MTHEDFLRAIELTDLKKEEREEDEEPLEQEEQVE